ncbi:carbohydrate ABC transporter substrate-binding protein, CUT1 family [Lentzea waywayandensis]|uniref:Carbohydrate ABC transporter substrate-binding protein, CUT1 family n=1 Tax=Lentzea waywayandensis TaxID=84724 RepID=A0A1I6DIA8_9PSEU|nr:sugar ABC transporter substrate-binding protein [Lentzea waywayandensis]SFR05121.1 carbohydrate ABC transporter substrate-binding protein, CUT1 family [Lentzea waywayandensis]
MSRLIALICTALLALTACSGSAASGPKSLRMTVWTANEAHLKLLNDIATEYKASHPDVTEIKYDSIPADGYTTTLTTQIAGGNAPDLAWILEESAPDFVASGALAPIRSKVEKADELVPSATKLWEKDGELYAYPFSTSPFGLFVNTSLVKDVPETWTWDQAMAAAAASGKGLVLPDFKYQNWAVLSAIWRGWGANAWSEDGRSCGFSSKEMKDAMTFVHKAIFTDKAIPGPGTTVDFFAGDASMAVSQISRAGALKDAKFTWTLVPLPQGPKGDYAVIGQAGVGVLKRSKNADAAADFLGFLTNEANSAKLAQFFPPVRASLLNAETLAKSNPLIRPEQLQSVVIEGINKGVVKPSHQGQEELNQTIRAALDPLWKPDANVGQVLDGVCAKIKPLLERK